MYEVGAKDVERSVEKVVDILASLKTGIKDELEYARASYVVNAGCLLDEPEELNFQLGYEEKLLGREDASFEKRVEAYKAVTPERMTRIVREIFTKDNLVLTFKDNKKRIDKARISEILERL